MATLTGIDNNSMINYQMKVRLLVGTQAECEARMQFYREHREYGFSNLAIDGMTYTADEYIEGTAR